MHEPLRYILGADRILSDKDPIEENVGLARITGDPDGKLRMLAPVLFNPTVKKAKEERAKIEAEERGRARGYSVNTVSIVTQGGSGNFRMSWNIPGKNLIAEDPSPLIAKHRVKHVAEFDYSKVERIQEFVKEVAAVTFIMENVDCASKFIKGLDLIKKPYSHSTFFGHRDRGNRGPYMAESTKGDLLTVCATFFDLGMTIPIYNPKRDHGMCVFLNNYWPKSSDHLKELFFHTAMAFGVSKHEDNLLYVDGSSLRNSGWVGSEYKRHWVDILKMEKDRRSRGTDSYPSQVKTGPVLRGKDVEESFEGIERLAKKFDPAKPKKKKAVKKMSSDWATSTSTSHYYYTINSSTSTTDTW